MSNIESTKGEIVMYQPDETIRLEVRVESETVWLTQQQISDFFLRDRTVINRHINNVFKEGECDKESNVHFLHIPNSDKPIWSRWHVNVGGLKKTQESEQRVITHSPDPACFRDQ